MKSKAEMVELIKTKMQQQGVSKSQLGALLGVNGTSQAKVQRANLFLNINNQKINIPDLIKISQLLNIPAGELLLTEESLLGLKQVESAADSRIKENHLVFYMNQ